MELGWSSFEGRPRKVSLPDLLCAFWEDPSCPVAQSDLIRRSPSMVAFPQESTNGGTRASSKMWPWGKGPPLSPLFTLQGPDVAFPLPSPPQVEGRRLQVRERRLELWERAARPPRRRRDCAPGLHCS